MAPVQPRFARVAAAIGDPTRALMLARLLDGRHYTAKELAEQGGVAPATASQHLKLLVDERLLRVRAQGRHRYFTLADGNVAQALEALLRVADGALPETARWQAPAMRGLRRARSCYGHLAGELVRRVEKRFQGPAANGMPELHSLSPALSVLQGRGYKVALVTDGRMSGASGKVMSAIHVTPEARVGGLLAKVRDGDVILVDANAGVLEIAAAGDALAAREAATPPPSPPGFGREYFAGFRKLVNDAEAGASVLFS